ncbi:MAG: internal scaffolding protein [Microvirus sp.]|nr:MAG: internal scaffolding protein [Microvirus sp.]
MSISTRQIIQNKTIFNTPHSPQNKVSLIFPPNSDYTKQEFKNESDINIIMAQYQYTGELPNLNTNPANYMDCTGLDYMEHMNQIVEANNLFAALPSSIRNRFQNNPAAFLDFVHDPENKPEMQKMGLLDPISPIVIPPKEEPVL